MEQYSINDIPLLKAVAFSSGDGWKDTTEKGEEIYVWGVVEAPPYVGNSLPRVGRGKWIWSVTPELHYYRRLKETEFFQVKSMLENSDEVNIIQGAINDGRLLPIADMDKFLSDMRHPDEGGLVGTHERLGIKTSKPKVVTAHTKSKGGGGVK